MQYCHVSNVDVRQKSQVYYYSAESTQLHYKRRLQSDKLVAVQKFSSTSLALYHSCEMEPEYDYLFKIVLIGDSGVGKSSIVKRYEEEIFVSSNLPTIGVDFCIKTLQVDLNAVKVLIWHCHTD